QTADKEENISLEDLIESFVEKNELSGDECILVDRETLWMDVVKFYKRSLTKPDILRKELCVSFKNEEGLDGGAMKIEFFSLALNEVKSRLFEGAEPNMVPIKDATKAVRGKFEMRSILADYKFVTMAEREVETHSFSERQAYEWLKSYINEDEDEEFPAVLRIPTVHSSKKGFFEAMNIALKFEVEKSV
ncbi:E3 ubiquitin- ligase, partial [Paramuricea clavata]